MSDYDVIIIGGGPSGLSAGTTTAKEGLTTLIVEEHPKVGEPLACGEGISLEKLVSLENMPKPDTQFDDQVLKYQHQNSFIEREVETQRFFFGAKAVATAKLSTLTIDRPAFDRVIANNALKNGAELMLKTTATGITRNRNNLEVKTSKGSYKTKIVIGCDGPSAHSVRMMKLQPPSDYVQGVEYKIQGVHTDALDFYFNLRGFPHMHYGWIFPKKNQTNVGIVVDLASKPMRILDQFIEYLNNIDIKKSDVIQKIAGIIPASGPIPKYYANNFLAAGDAAGMTNSIFYGGISIGIHSGMLAGATAVEAHENGDFSEQFLGNYQKKCQAEPYTDPIIQKAHNILYKDFSEDEINTIGSWVNGWDITTLNRLKKLHLLIKILLKPKMIKRINSARTMAYGFSKCRDWGF
ncbi:MAG: NAD(P)/FAD-dependent oxidoreductase [Candidatus Hodarchaeota archaeon]